MFVYGHVAVLNLAFVNVFDSVVIDFEPDLVSVEVEGFHVVLPFSPMVFAVLLVESETPSLIVVTYLGIEHAPDGRVGIDWSVFLNEDAVFSFDVFCHCCPNILRHMSSYASFE